MKRKYSKTKQTRTHEVGKHFHRNMFKICAKQAYMIHAENKDLCEGDKVAKRRSSKKEHKGNALALGADEGRDKLRKASGRRK